MPRMPNCWVYKTLGIYYIVGDFMEITNIKTKEEKVQEFFINMASIGLGIVGMLVGFTFGEQYNQILGLFLFVIGIAFGSMIFKHPGKWYTMSAGYLIGLIIGFAVIIIVLWYSIKFVHSMIFEKSNPKQPNL